MSREFINRLKNLSEAELTKLIVVLENAYKTEKKIDESPYPQGFSPIIIILKNAKKIFFKNDGILSNFDNAVMAFLESTLGKADTCALFNGIIQSSLDFDRNNTIVLTEDSLEQVRTEIRNLNE